MTLPSDRHVRRAEIEDLDQIQRVLADAFPDYPWTRWTVDARDHRNRIARLQRLVPDHVGLPYGQVWIASIASTIKGAAIWTDSRSPPAEHAWAGMASEQRSRRQPPRSVALCPSSAQSASPSARDGVTFEARVRRDLRAIRSTGPRCASIAQATSVPYRAHIGWNAATDVPVDVATVGCPRSSSPTAPDKQSQRCPVRTPVAAQLALTASRSRSTCPA